MPQTDEPDDFDYAADLAAFETEFKRSRKGNLWRAYGSLTLTVFRREGEGLFGWCIASAERRQFSRRGYETEREALGWLWTEVYRNH